MGRAVVYDLSGAREVKNIVVADFDRSARAGSSAQIRARDQHAQRLQTCATRATWRNCCTAATWW